MVKSSPPPKVLALILAGGEGSRLEVLTRERAKPVMPFAGSYRLIDFALSNCVHSEISNVWVIEQYEAHSLNDHLANGRPWDLDRTYGGLQVLPPYVSHENSPATEGGFAEGNADAIYRHREFIREFAPDLLVVLSADHIYKLDYRQVIEQHLAREADVTMVTTKVPRAEAARFGNVKVNREGLVTQFDYKPEKPTSDIVTTEVFIYNATALLKKLDELAEENQPNKDKKSNGNNKDNDSEGDDVGTKKSGSREQQENAKNESKSDKDVNQTDGAADKSSLKDFGHELIPAFVREGRAFEFRLKSYWRDVGTIESYWQSHMDLLAENVELELDDAAWAILTFGAPRLPAHIHKTARVENSMISSGCTVRGAVINSVLAPGVIVETGAVVSDSVVLHDAVVAKGAKVSCAIIDMKVHVGESATVGVKRRTGAKVRSEHGADEDKEQEASAGITVVGQRARVAAGATIERGERVEPNARVR